MNRKIVIKITVLLAFLAFAIFIIIGGVFITDILFNSKFDPSSVGINTEIKLNIAKLTIVMFWIVFIPLCILPFVLGFGYELF